MIAARRQQAFAAVGGRCDHEPPRLNRNVRPPDTSR
jgi:hypothetical protein